MMIKMTDGKAKNDAVVKPEKIKLSFKGLWQILKATGSDFSNARITRMSAALAYYTVFSIAPMLSFILLVSLIVSTVLDVLINRLVHLFPGVAVYLAYALNLLLTFIIITLLFGIIFKVLPDAKIKWRDVITGAITTALLFMLGKFAISFYLGARNIGNIYGAAGSIVIILLWVYYSAII